jgi:hypothetical protein
VPPEEAVDEAAQVVGAGQGGLDLALRRLRQPTELPVR